MRNKATKKNMDLDLRRYGKMLYSKAEESGGSDGGGSDGNNDIFFVPATIQPKYFIDDNEQPIEIKDFPSDIMDTQFLYNKEDIISLGIKESVLNLLPQVTIDEAYGDTEVESSTNRAPVNKAVFENITVLRCMVKENGPMQSNVMIYSSNINGQYVVYKISDDIFLILESTIGGGGGIPVG